MGKKEKKPKKPTQVWKLYESQGDKLTRKNKNCPKCGPGFFMAQHKDRLTCGNCHYTEFTGTVQNQEAQEEPKELKKEAPKEEAKSEEPKEETKEPVKEETSEEKPEVPVEKSDKETSEEKK